MHKLSTKTNHHPCAAANLPTEIWLQILVVAGIKSTAVMRLVCETLNRIGSDEWLWKHHAIELQNKKKRIPPRTDIGQVSFPSGVTPSWFEFCKLLAKDKRPPKIQLKIIILGDSCVGKTSFLHRYVRNRFPANLESTIGASFLTHTITIEETEVQLQMWDTAGPERFRSFGSIYYRGTDGVILAIDLTKRGYYSIEAWRNTFMTESGNKEDAPFPFIVVGTKNDLREQSADAVSIENETLEFCEKHSIPYFATSAKTGENVEEAMQTLALHALNWAVSANVGELGELGKPAISKEDPIKQDSCCCVQ